MKAKGHITRVDVNYPHYEDLGAHGNLEMSLAMAGPPRVEVEIVFNEGEGLQDLINNMLINNMKGAEPVEVEISFAEKVVKGKTKKVSKWRMIKL